MEEIIPFIFELESDHNRRLLILILAESYGSTRALPNPIIFEQIFGVEETPLITTILIDQILGTFYMGTPYKRYIRLKTQYFQKEKLHG